MGNIDKVKPTDTSSSLFKILLIGINMVLIGLLAYFGWTTVHSSDDYWYATFWDHGLAHYMEMMELHYQTFNGRSLVHFLAHLILHFDNWAFALACCGLCTTAILMACKSVHRENHRTAEAMAFFLAGLMLMPKSIFAEGFMWISAFCNYLYPVTLICIMINLRERGKSHILLILMSFICGATTEQMGMTTVGILLIYTIEAVIRRKGFGVDIACVGASLIGLLTIFLSPASQNRVSANFHSGDLMDIIADLLKTASREAEILTENGMPLLVILLFLLLSGKIISDKSGKVAFIPVSIVGIVGIALWAFGSGGIQVTGAVIVFLSLAIESVALIVWKERASGVFMLAALLSSAVILPMHSVGPRLMLPFYTLALLSICSLYPLIVLRVRERGIILCAVLGLSVIALIPVMQGCWHNHQLDRMNKNFAVEDHDKKILRFCADFNYDYTWKGKVHTNLDYQKHYLVSLGMPEDTEMFYFTGAYDPPVINCDGVSMVAYAACDEEGNTYFPLRKLIEFYDGSVAWTPEHTVIHLDQREYIMRIEEDTAYFTFQDQSGRESMIELPCMSYYGVTYCAEPLLTDILGCSVGFQKADNCYDLISEEHALEP